MPWKDCNRPGKKILSIVKRRLPCSSVSRSEIFGQFLGTASTGVLKWMYFARIL